MSEKRISHEQYLACALYQFAGENPLGTFESQEILNKLKPIEISDTLSRSFFHVCASLWAQNLAVDLGSIISGVKEFQIGAEKVMFLSDMHYTTSSWEYHLQELTEIIQKTALLSGLKRELSESGTKTSVEIKTALEGLVLENVSNGKTLVDTEEVHEELFGEGNTRVLTYVDVIDIATDGGFEVGQTVVIACRPGHGKTSIASQITTNRIKNKQRSIVFNMEMNGAALFRRIIAQKSGLDLRYIKNCRKIGAEATQTCTNLYEEVRDEITLHTGGGMDLDEIKQGIQEDIFKCERKGLPKPTLVIVDYLQLMNPPESAGANLSTQIGALSRGLKEIAMKLGVCIVILSQLSRKIEDRIDPIPKNSDLRDSGSIESDASVIFFVHRPSMFSSDASESSEEGQACDLIFTKQREGALGAVPVNFYPKSGRWT